MMVRRAVNKSTNLTLNRLIDLQPTSTIGLFRNKFEDQQRWSRDSRTVVQRLPNGGPETPERWSRESE